MKKILIVDDTKISHMVLGIQLESFNVEVDNAYSGIEAIELVDDNDYDIILMDMSMPHMDGNETTIEIKKIKPDSIIYSITAFDKEDVCDSLYNGHFQKPIIFEDLSKTLLNNGFELK